MLTEIDKMRHLLTFLLISFSATYGQNITHLVPFRHQDKWGFADTSLNIVVQPTYDYVSNFENGHANIKVNGLFGLMDSTSQIVIPIQYQSAFDLTGNLSWTQRNSDWIIIDKKGTEIIPDYKYDSRPFRFNEGLSEVIRNGKYGFVNEAGKEVIPCIYDSSSFQFQEGFVAVRKGSKWGYLNKQGTVVIDFKYNTASDFQEGRAVVADWSKGYGFVDTTGKEVIPLQYQLANPFYCGFAWVITKNKTGFIDRNGNILIAPKFLWCNNFQEGFTTVGKNLISKVYNVKGKAVKTSFRYEDIDYFCEGLAAVNTRKEKYGYIDTTGRLVIKLKYDFADEFHDGLAAIEIKGKSGYINHKGELVIPTIYNNAFNFENGIAEVERNGKMFYIDTKGKEYIKW
jgi:hypothetical protein